MRCKTSEYTRFDAVAKADRLALSELFRRGAEIYVAASRFSTLADRLGMTRLQLVVAALELAQQRADAGAKLPRPTNIGQDGQEVLPV